MDELLAQAELFEGLSRDGVRRLSEIARSRSLAAGEYLFLLGDDADHLYIVVSGNVELCFPMSLHGTVKDITVESAAGGQLLGWSALVKPYRFTLSARAAEPSVVVGFLRQDLMQLFETAPEIGYRFVTKLCELVGVRLLRFQALWVRELQRTLLNETTPRAR
jgi:CRP-like cAMP-binding protein